MRILFVLISLFGIFNAHAAMEEIPASYRWYVNVSGANTGFHNTAQLACDSFGETHAANNNASAPTQHKTYTYQGLGAKVTNQQYLCIVKNQLNVDGSFSVLRQWSCGANWNTGTNENYFCTVPACVAPEIRQPDGSCQAPPNCTAGEIVSSGLYDIGLTPTSKVDPISACHRGCWVTFEGDSPVSRQMIDGYYHYFARGDYGKTGESCSIPGDAPGGLGGMPGPTCAAGQVMGNNGGKTTCSTPNPSDPSNPKPANPHTPDAPKPDDTATEEKDPPVQNPDGSTTETTRTTNPDGSTKTETKTTNPDGSSTTTTTTTAAPTDPDKTPDPLKDFCSTNPNNKLCKDADVRSWQRTEGLMKEFDLPTKDEEIEQKKDEFKQLLAQIRSEVEGLFNWNGAGGGGQLGCSGSVSILGANFQICLGQYSEQLSQIASGLVFLSLLLALFIILA